MAKEVMDILPAVPGEVSRASTTISIDSRTPSVIIVHSGYSTVSPMSHQFIDMLEDMYDSGWRDALMTE